METAYCPYCGNSLAVRGQAQCPHCGADIIDIWKLLSSHLDTPSLVRPAPTRPRSLDWIGPAVIISLGLVLFGLAAYWAIPWLADKLTLARAGDFIPPISAGSNSALALDQLTPTPLAIPPTPTAVPLSDDAIPFLEHGQVIYLESLGYMDGYRWLSADPATSSVYLSAAPDESNYCCWQVINPEQDNTIQLTLITPGSQPLYLTANPQTEQIWLSPPEPSLPAQSWEVVQHADGSISLLNLAEGRARYLDGLTLERKVALAPTLDASFSGAYWEVQPVPPEALEVPGEAQPETEPTAVVTDPCLSGSRLAAGMKAAVIEGGGRNRLRKNPSLTAKIIELIAEGDPVKILDGPECNDGLIWWRVRVLETGSTGWTAEMQDGEFYLRPVD